MKYLPENVLIEETIKKYGYDPRIVKGKKNYKNKVVFKCFNCNYVYDRVLSSVIRIKDKMFKCIKCVNTEKSKATLEIRRQKLKDGYKSGRIKHGMLGNTHSPESKQKLSKARKGKKWEEIYGIEKSKELKKNRSEWMSGEGNPFFGKKHTDETKQKIIEKNIQNNNSFGKKKFSNSKGEKFRSRLEVQFSEFLIENNIQYQYELPIKMINNKFKIVDFALGDILIEITGIAYKKWENNFLKSIKILKNTVQNKILIFTYKDKVDNLVELKDDRTHIFDINSFKNIYNFL